MRDAGGKDEEDMSTRADGSGPLAVGPLAFDPESGELTGPAGAERIAPQPASLLDLLASHPGEVLTRDEIREHLWPGGKVEFEQGIAFAVREIRKAIEAVGGDPATLETIPKRGFRLVATGPAGGEGPVARPTDEPLASAATPPPPRADEPAAGLPAAPERAESWRVFVRPLVMLAIVGGVGLFVLIRGGAPESLPGVVVFVHDTDSDAHAELARALGFELTAALTRAFAGRLGVVGPTGTSTLTGPNDTEGARVSLGACLVVSGNIRAVSADSVVVFTQVVRTSDRFHAWASTDAAIVATAGSVVIPQVVEGVEAASRACRT
jgi:DNA-binding winged helix-turn-helix (wHTH) protein/TolB-like protein